MKNYRVEAIVIKRLNINEADRLIWLLTKEQGFIRVKARGVRKIKAKLKGGLELFVNSKIDLARGNSIDVITGVQIIESFSNLRNNLSSTSVSFYFSELIISLLSDQQSEPEIYRLLRSSLERLDRVDSRQERDLVVAYFLVKLLSLAGYQPELNRCFVCGNRITDGGNRFGLSQGGLICKNCRIDRSVKINLPTIKLIRHLITNDRLGRVKIGRQYLAETIRIMEQFVEEVIERRLKSNQFLKEVNNA